MVSWPRSIAWMDGTTPAPPLHGGGHAGGFTAAARAELIVRSALSTSVRNLERELGAELFDRTGRRVVLTGAGRALLPSARSCSPGRRRRGTRWRP
ncbi:LysR family transcriptional regulator [Streptomyces sp. NPDC058357]|uniref:LysR family transcriptional regulator n=1 Tax=unclassified Streptomyces TaxID=2593676 RepID=UPI003655467B